MSQELFGEVSKQRKKKEKENRTGIGKNVRESLVSSCTLLYFQKAT